MAGGVITAQRSRSRKARRNNTVDFGLIIPANLGNQVFCDLNNDGIRNGADTGLSGVLVSLFDAPATAPSTTRTSLEVQDYEMTTDGNGNYQFINLIPAPTR